jgi:2-phosphoglycolate phosphatase
VTRFDPSAVRAVVFDLDGTLLDSYAAIHESLNSVLRAFGRPEVTLGETRTRVGYGLEALIAGCLGPQDVAEGVRLFRESYERAGPESSSLLPGADDVTRTLAARGLPLAIASNKPAYFSRQLLSRLGIADRFAVITGPDDGFPPKPAPHMVLVALAKMGTKASESLFVGDMPIDVATARAAGMPVAVLPTGSATRAELEAASPDLLLPGLPDLMQLLDAKAGQGD